MIEPGTLVRYSKQKWVVSENMGALTMIENDYDVRVVPTTSLKEVKK